MEYTTNPTKGLLQCPSQEFLGLIHDVLPSAYAVVSCICHWLCSKCDLLRHTHLALFLQKHVRGRVRERVGELLLYISYWMPESCSKILENWRWKGMQAFKHKFWIPLPLPRHNPNMNVFIFLLFQFLYGPTPTEVYCSLEQIHLVHKTFLSLSIWIGRNN